jgi:hypothetical protein
VFVLCMGRGDVEQQLLEMEPAAAAETQQLREATQSSRGASKEVTVGKDVLGPYVLDRLCGRVECPRKPAEGAQFVPPAGPWSELPEWCHVGEWSPAATAFFALMFVLLCAAMPVALGIGQREQMAEVVADLSADGDAISWTPVLARAIGGTYGIALLAGMLKEIGWWPLVTYTMISWTLLSLRLLFAAAAPFSASFAWAAELIRYIALMQTTVVVVVWWLAITPLVLLLEKNPAKRKEFWNWNFSFALVNVHCLNLPVAALDFLSAPRALMPMDVFIVGAVTLTYVLFYTLVLDRNGIFLYFMFTPRHHWCCVIYAATLVLMGMMLWAWVGIGGCGMTSFSW